MQIDFKQLKEGEMTLKVGTRDVILACAMGDVELSFINRFMFLENLYIAPKIKGNLYLFLVLLNNHIM